MDLYTNNTREKKIDNGFIYPLFYYIIIVLKFLNLVEWLKKLSKLIIIYFNKDKMDINYSLRRKIRRGNGFAIDLFIVIKFAYLISIWILDLKLMFFSYILFYLLFMNQFTYFYYHIWDKGALLESYLTVARVRRKFINLIQSIFFMILGFAYIYVEVFTHNFSWGIGGPSVYKSLYFSLSNALPLNFKTVSPITNTGYLIQTFEIFMTFIFIAVILAKSIPKANKE